MILVLFRSWMDCEKREGIHFGSCSNWQRDSAGGFARNMRHHEEPDGGRPAMIDYRLWNMPVSWNHKNRRHNVSRKQGSSLVQFLQMVRRGKQTSLGNPVTEWPNFWGTVDWFSFFICGKFDGLYFCVLQHALKCICVCMLQSISSFATIFCFLVFLFFEVENR